jgi:hypothetical protein
MRFRIYPTIYRDRIRIFEIFCSLNLFLWHLIHVKQDTNVRYITKANVIEELNELLLIVLDSI